MLSTWSTSPLLSLTFFYLMCLLLCTKTQIQMVKDYLAKNVNLMRALVCQHTGQHTVQTQAV